MPSDLPITDFLDELVDRLAGPPDIAGPPFEWTLSPLGGDALAPHHTLREAGVDDGTWLVLREGPAEEPAVLVDDTLDALAELADARHRSWSPETAGIAAAATAACATVVAAVGLAVARFCATPGGQHVATAVAVLGAVALLAAALFAGRARVRSPIPTALCVMSATLSAAAGFVVVPGGPGAANALLAAAAASTSAAITLRYTRIAPVAHLAAITAGCLAAATAAVCLAGMSRAPAAALIAVVALLVVLAAPRLTVVLAKIPLPPVPSPGEPFEPVETPLLPTIDAVDAISLSALPDLDALVGRAEHARQCLAGLCLGAASVAAIAVTITGIDPPDWRFTTIGIGVALALVLRGRSHTDLAQAAALVGSGAAALLGYLTATIVGAVTLDAPSLPLPTAAAALAVAATALAIGGWAAGRTFSPLQRRAAELAEYGLLVVLLPLLLWAMEVYRMIREAW
ncbi:hypothetical protein GOARA_021_01310 [Gordonia araii NBRC 100433]|uniref:EccD-like transmembrane domain-containing protein n=1 Tax=Gordonia araii NBRC 100433 TaxID=1073574 RepID=G7GZ69_9ACTN|nr:hypothetical protein GOARA_021_01310 [Gordonia araii NBRC 100433]